MTNDSHPRISAPIAVVVSTLCLVFLGASIVGYIRREIQQSMKDFRQRHLEATQAIQRAYAHFREQGRWPAKADLERAGQRWLPPEWQYESDPEQGGPVMWLHGPSHMILSYKFELQQQGAVSNTWTLSVEGGKSTFPAKVGYSLVDTQLPTAEEINVFDSLDERHAVEVFLGKDLEQAEALFRENFLSRLDSLNLPFR